LNSPALLVRLNHVTRFIVNANYGIVRADEKLTAFIELESVMLSRGVCRAISLK
jgi:hypothetical protein